jgi:hypothetical protein
LEKKDTGSGPKESNCGRGRGLLWTVAATEEEEEEEEYFLD